MEGRTAAVVVTHRGRGFLQTHLPTLLEQSRPFGRVIVVDNASTDGTAELLRSFGGLEVLTLSRNQGFAGGANRGVEAALGDPAVARVAVVNDDVSLAPTWHEAALAALETADDVGSCATCLAGADDPDLVHSAGIVMRGDWIADNHLHGRPVADRPDFPMAVWGASAAAALYRRELLETTGLFLELLFAYQEDVELALRSRRMGWKCVLAPGAQGLHLGFGTDRRFPLGGTWADFFNARNRLTILLTTLPAAAWRRDWKKVTLAQGRLLIRSLAERRSGAVCAGVLHGLVRLPRAWAARRGIRARIGDEHQLGLRTAAWD